MTKNSGTAEEVGQSPLCRLTRERAGRRSSDNHHIVVWMYPWAQRAKRFTDEPFDPVALDAFADFFAGGDAQARTGSRCVLQARKDVYHKIAIQVFPTFLIGTLEFPPFFEPVWVQYFCCSQCLRSPFLLQ